MFKILLEILSVTNSGGNLVINDTSDWTTADNLRSSFGVFVKGEYRLSATPSEVAVDNTAPLTASQFIATTDANGRYSFTAYAFYRRDEVVPAEGDVHIFPDDGLLYQWVSAAWVEISLEDAITQEKFFYTSDPLEVPFLAYAYAYKNQLNLEYIKQVKNDINSGIQQNKLYYKRTDLDYFSALITGAEYNWSIDLYGNYYDIVTNLNLIINTKQIS